ncbi:MAG: DUF11 domain-containing protein [Lysobacter sp.]|nr:DUF11 domain-containing protein [Lysobacter sp.]
MTCIADKTRRSIVATIVFGIAFVASPVAWSQNAVNSATITPPATVTDPNNANNSATDSDAITRTANLSLTKTASPSPVVVGQLLTYTLTLGNAGPSAIAVADTLSILESLPAGLTGCSFTPSTGTFNVGTIASGATGTGTWTGVAIPSGGTATLTIACTVGAAAAASITNTATVIPPTGVSDPDCSGAPVTCAGGNTGSVTTPVNRPVLTLTKTASAASFTVGVPASYTLSVQNTGTAATTAVSTITDTIPAGLTIGTLPAGCTAAGQTVTCTIAAGLAVNATTSFVIPVTPTAAAASPAVNTATVTGGGDPTCPAAAHCTSTTTTPVNRPVLTLTKTASAASFTVGVPASYTLSVQNTGTAATTAVSTITDTIPAGLTIGTLPAGCTAAGQTVTCTIAAGLAINATTSFVIPVTPTAAAASPAVNTAMVTGGGDPTCPAAAHCTSTTTTPVNRPNINIAKTAGTATGPSVGGIYSVTYTVTVTNSGAAAGTYGALTDSPVFPAATTPTGIVWTTSGAGAPPAGSQAGGGAYTLAPAGNTIGAGVTHTFNVTVTYVFTSSAPPTVCAATPTPGSGLYNAVSLPAGQENGAVTDNAVCVNSPPQPPLLTLTKTASAASFVVGVPASYTLSVQNTGGVATTAVSTITDTIPAGLTIGTLPAGCTAAGQTVTCTIAAGLAVNATTSFVIPVTPTAAAASPAVNTATVTGGGDPTCPAAAHCTSTTTTPVNAPVLTLTKTASAASFTVGVPASYTLSVQNTGTAATTAVSTITDTIPTGLTIGTLPAGCTAAGQTVTCTIPAGLAVSATTSFIIPITPTAAAASPAVNTATVTGGGDPTCPAAAHCTSTTTTPVNAPVLTLTKTASAASFTVGVPASYTLSVQNTGTAATTAVSTITDTIPAGLTIGTLPAGCTAAGQTVTCTIAAGLAVNATTSFVIPVTPTAAAASPAVNTATVTGGGDPTCPAAAHCTSTTTTPVNRPVLTLTKTASAASFTVGVPASYTLSVQNTGTAATTAVSTITDTIPAGLTIGTLPAGCTAAGQTVTCTIAAGLAINATTSFVIPVTPTAAAASPAVNTATVTGGGDPTCPAAAHCNSTTTTPVNAPVLTLTKTASAASFTVGVPASYTLSVQNTGTAATTAVSTITDTIPTGLTIGTLPAGCTAAGQTVTCTIPAGLAVSATSSFIIPITPTAAAASPAVNTATVTGGGDPTCPAAAHCTSTTTTPVNAPVLTLTKTASAASFTVGVPASYTLSVQNTGTAATTAVSTITDTIPTGLTIGTLPAGCTAAGQTVTCTIAAGLAVNATTSFVIPVTPTAAAASPAVNTATVTGGGDPTCPAAAHCTSTTTTPVNAPVLTLTKTASAASFTVGVPASYTLSVQNTGTAATTAVSTITDTIPTGLTIGTLPAGCTAAGQTVTCTIPAGLAVSATSSFIIPITPTAAAASPAVNTATVTGGGDPTCPAAAHCTSTTTTPVNAPVLTLTKTASAASFTVGVPASYTLSVQNTGTAATTAVSTITDTIPTGLTIGTLPAGCTAAGQTVTCTIAAGLAVNATTSFVIPVTPTAAAASPAVNTATVTGGGDPTCPAAAHCTSTTTTPVNAPVLTLTKTASAASFTVGVPASYTLSVQNTGTAATTAVSTITDTIPTGLTIGTLPAGCTAAGQTVTCTIPAGLAVSATSSFIIPITPTAAAASPAVNTATVTGGGDPTCPAAAHCTSTTTTPVSAPQLTLTKTASAASFTVGVPASYTLSVQNTGTAATTAVSTITDTIPTGLTIGTLPAGCTAAGQTVTCTIAAGLAVNATTSFVIPVTPTAAAASPAVNTATVTGGGDPTCPAAAHCTSTTTTPVNAPVLTLTKTASAASFTVGVPASYTLSVQNTGTAATTAVSTITDTIPAGLTIGTLPAGCTAAGQTVTCTIAAGLAINATTSFVIPVTPTAAAASPAVNTATVTGGGDPTCPAAAHCTSTTTTPVNAPVLTLTKTASAASFTVGVPASYTLSVQNTGTAATTAVSTITDTIPAGLTIGTLPAGCTAAGQTVTCTIAAGLAINATTSFVIPVTPTAAAASPAVNTATVTGGGDPTCPAAAHCTSTTTTPVNAPVLTLTKTASAASFTVGVPASYTLSVQNTGTAATTAVSTITDTIPTGLTIGTLPAGCTAAGQTVTCTIPAGLAVSATTSFIIPITPTAAAASPAVNTATVTGGGDPTCPAAAHCTSTTTTPVSAPQLTLTKTASAASFTVGVPASYTLSVQNTGSAATTAVSTITDTIPTGLTIGTLPAGCTASGQTVTCTIAAGLAVNATTSFVIPITPTAAAASPAVNTATVSGGGDPTCPAAAHCTSTVTTPITSLAIDAVDDDYSATPVNGASGGSTPSVLVNDTLNGNPVTVGAGGNVTLTPGAAPAPTAGSITMNADGTITVAAGTTAGVYTYPYTICEVLNPTNCDTATATIVVSAAVIDAVDDTGTVANGAVGGVGIPNVLVNDTLNGAPATLATVTITQLATTNPGVTLNPATGAVSVAPGTPAGTYDVTYEICETLNPTNCDVAIATVTVGAAVIDAVDDTGTVPNGATGGTAVANVLVNDTLNGVPATLATVVITQVSTTNPNVTLNPATGAVTVAPGTPAGTYTLVYQICEQLNPTNCDTATVTVTVGAAVIDAVDDDYSATPVNGASGGSTPSVLVNDTLNGNPVTVGAGGNVTLTPGAAPAPTAGSITMNADGTITVAAGTTAGVYTYPYTICEVLNPTNCDTATATIVVSAAVIDAVDDTGTVANGAVGGVGIPNVLVNDTLNGAPATLATVTITQLATTNPGVTLNPATGAVSVAPGTPAGTYDVTYEICETLNPTNCDVAIATVTVGAAVIDAVDDTGTVANGATGGTAVANVLVNDTLNGVPATLATVVITQVSTTNPNVTLNPATGAVTVAPGTPAGTYTLVYQICEQLNPTNCDTATVTVTVGAAVIDAVDDDYSATPVNGASVGSTPSVLVNDTLNGNPVTVGAGGNVTLTPGAAPAPTAGSITMNADGTITVAAGTTAGVYTYPYTICEVLNPTNCDTATATIVVSAAVIDAVDDTGTVANGAVGGVGIPNVLVNDTLNGAPATLATVTITQLATTNPGVTLNPATGAVSVAPGTPAGTYDVTYEICETLNPTNCDVAIATVTVGAAVIDAVDDTGTVANGATGGTAVANVLVNDTLNGVPATLATVVITQVSTTNPNVTLNPATGAVTVAPGTPAGTYTLVYQICEQLNPTNCDTATVTVTVGAAVIDAVDDDYSATPVNGASGGSTPSVLVNDTLNGNPVTVGAGGNVTLTPGAAPAPTAGSITMNADGTITVAAGTTAGVYTYPYTICEVLNPTNCDTATATIVVSAAVIDAVDDTGTVANGAVGGVGIPNVLVNDTLNGAPATLATVTITQLATTNPGVTLNPATGAVSVAPGTPAGTYDVTYEICETLNPTNCDVAIATVTVGAAVIDAVDDTGTVANGATGGTAVANVLVNDTLNGVPATLATVVITQVSTTNPNVTLNPATGAVTVAPGTPAGTYTLVYQICEQLNPTNCDTATVTVTVGAAVIDAVDDDYSATPVNGASGGSTPSVLVNDTLNGNPVTVGAGGNVTLTPGAAPAPTAGSITMNADGTITVAAGTTAGVYTYPYTICEVLNPTNCDTATATIVVSAAVIDAVDDTGTVANGAVGGVGIPNVLVNDTLNGAPATLATVTITQLATTNPGVTLNPATGAVSVAPGTPAGTYDVTYEICETLNPTNCDVAIATVTVGAAVIDAVDDTGTVANGATGGTAVANVLVNDTLNGVPATLATVVITQVSTTNPNVTLNPATGAVTVAPGTPAGTYTLVYQICEQLNPTNCDTATVTVTVGAAVIDAVDDDYSATPVNGASGGSTPSVLVNDTLNGNPVTVGAGGNVTLTPGAAPAPTAGSITMNADGTITVAAGTTAGVYTYPYTICEVLNPTNCDTATATIVVSAAVIDAVDDTGTVANGAVGGVGIPNVLVNDTLNGAPATLATVTITQLATTNPGVTLNPATGAVSVAPGTPAGTYDVTYEICETLNPTNCDVAIATVTVGAAVIDAVDDTGTVANGATGGTAVANVLVNDTLNGVPATLATVVITQVSTTNPNVTLNPATGAVTVAPGTPAGTYTLVYQICEQLNPTNCDTATVTVTVGAAVIDAVDDDYSATPVNGASGGSTPSVLVNDTLNGNPVTVGAGGNVTLTPGAAPAPTAGSITMNADGTITVAAGTTAGVYTYPYTICEVLNPTNCDTATATIVVSAAVIDAVDDTGTVANGAVGGVGIPNVLVNDTLNGAPATLATVTITQLATTNPGVTLNPATGAVSVAPGTPAGTYDVTYEICETLNPTNCDVAIATVTVGAAVIDAVDDTGTVANGATGGTAVANVLVNDTLNGVPATLATVVITQVSTTNPNVTLNPATGAVTVAPGTPAGTYTLVYQICEQLNPTNCDTATVTVTVGAAVIDAVDDDYSATPVNGASGGSTPSVLVNDTLNGNPVTVGAGGNVTLTPGAAPAPTAGSITMNADGTITVAAGTTAGVYTYPYTICEVLNPTNCDTATATVVVSAAVIDAVDDNLGPVVGASGGNTPSVLVNDTLNGGAVTVGAGGNSTLTPGAAPTPAAGSITMNPDGTITIAPGTTAGTYTYPYTICEVLNPTNCDTATATIVVSAAVIDAVDDSGTVANGANGGVAVPNVLVNDTLNGVPVTLATVTLTQVSTTNPNVTLNPATGAVTVAPGTPAGTYTLVYRICEILNPNNCDTATVTVTVGAAVIDAVDDNLGPVVGASGGNTPSVLVNDTLNGGAVTVGAGGNSTLTPGAAPTPAAGSITMNPDGTITIAPGTTAGTYTYPYTICEVLNPTNCDTATATIVVSAAVIDAVDDSGTVANGANGGVAVPNVLVNDTLNGVPVTLATVTLTQVSTTNPNVTLNPATGAVTVAPGTPAGTYTLVYRICEILNPNNCDTATVTVTVGAAVIDAVDDNLGPVVGASGGNTPSVLVNDTLNGGAVTVGAGGNSTLTPGAAPTPAAGSITMNPDGTITIAPGTTAGTYTYPYTICEVLNPTNCDTATATIVVSAAVIDAVDDSGTVANGANGGVAVPNVLVNDTLNGVPVTLATVTLTQVSTTNPNVTLNPATGAVTVAPGTPAGTYTLVYRICEILNPNNCDTATVTVTVGAAPIDAIDDSFGPANGATGNPNAGNAYTNDTLNGVPVNVADITGSVTTPATPINGGPVPVLDPQTGNVSVPAGTPAGTYTIVYRICENLNPTNCDSATITVTVDAAPIDAVDDAFPPVNGVGGGSTASVLVNDTLNGVAVNPADVTLTPGTAPTPGSGSIVMNPDGTITVGPNTEAGTYQYPYTICEVLNPTNCDTAIATVVVSAQPGLTIDKIAGTPTANSAGGTIPYSFVVTNTGNVTVTGLTINDAQLSAAAVCPTTTLAPGATTTCTGSHTITQADVDAGTVVNTATATGTLPRGGTTVSPPDSTTTTIVQTPAITAVKTATLTTDGGLPGLADPGDVITYNVTVRNSGNVTLSSLVVNDSFEGGASTTLNCAPTTLAPGATATCASYTHTVTVAEAAAGGTLENVVTATATSSTSTQTVTSTSTAVVNVNGEPAAIRIIKTANPRDVKVGDLVRYTLTMQNTSITPMVDGTLIDTPPAGFTYVEGSLAVVDADNAGRLVGTYPIRVDQLDIAGEGSATITYLLRVGAGVRPGVHTNSAYVEDNGEVVSNVATANVQMTSDPLMDESLIVGTVFSDRDGDRWQDTAGLSGVRVQGGFAPEAYVPNSTTVDRGAGPTPEPDASSPMLHGIDVGDITARQSEADPIAKHTVVIRQTLRELRFTDDFALTTAQGVTVRMSADGKTSVDKAGDAAKGLNAAEPTVERRVSQVADGYVVDYVIANAGIDERGIPGVRIASVEGLLMETDQYGRYHLTGVDGGRERGRNFILKVDPATLPPGSTLTTDNPLVKRVTPGVPTRFDFGVKMPVAMLEGGAQTVEMELGEIVFHAESAKLREEYLPVIEKIAEQVRSHGNGEVVLAANGETQSLAYDRAKAVQTALLGMLSKDEAQAVKISLRSDLADPDSTLVSLGESPVLGMVLFDTDQSAIKPEFEPVIAKVAADIERLRGGVVGIIGHADKRGSAEYNVALGMRRAKAVYEAIAAKLSPEVRSKLRVDFSDNPTAPVGIRGQ